VIPSTYRVKPAVHWAGAKSRLLKHLLPLIPEHACYAEPFSGGLAVLLAKPRSAVEVINDVDGDLVRFYRCVRFHVETLLTELEFVLNAREELRETLRTVKGRWLVTLNDAPAIRGIFEGCRFTSVERAMGINAKSTRRYRELIIQPPATRRAR